MSRIRHVGTSIAMGLLASVTMGAKCPNLPPPRHDGGAGPDGAAGAGGTDGGSSDASADAPGDAPADAAPPPCSPASPLDVWDHQDLPSSFAALFAVATDDVWAIPDPPYGLQRWNGSSWSTVLTVSSDDYLYSLWASGPRDVWVGGIHLRHWDGAAWTDATPPALVAASPKLMRIIWGRAPNDVWLDVDGPTNRIFHFDGSVWTEIAPPPSSASGEPFHALALWASSPGDLWVGGALMGASSTTPELLHWNGSAWETAATPSTGVSFNAVWGSGASDVWAGGWGEMLHFDGTVWATVSNAPSVVESNAPTMWGSCASNVWATPRPDESGSPRLAHFDGNRWSTIYLDGAPRTVTAIGGTGPDDVWAASFIPGAPGGVLYHHHPGDPGAVCGNGRLDPGEGCDPPHPSPAFPGCDSTCQVPPCGDLVVGPGEECDPPNGDTCDTSCQRRPICGDHFIDAPEQCDPPDGVVCGPTCQLIPTCGNGRIDPGEECDPPNPVAGCDSSCRFATCQSTLQGRCDDALPCCAGLVCSGGACLREQPACAPDGGICSPNHPCCSGAACIDGLCGGACVNDGAACDGSRPCCAGPCANGLCGGSACVPGGVACDPAVRCCSPTPICTSACGEPGCARIGWPCSITPKGCCTGTTCVLGTCRAVIGCYPPGQDCRSPSDCCSGVCRMARESSSCL